MGLLRASLEPQFHAALAAGCATAPPTPGAEPERLAVAYSNLDGVDGYDPDGADVLIAKLVDIGTDGRPSLGYAVVVGKYPLDLTATSFGSVGNIAFPDLSRTTVDRFDSGRVAVQVKTTSDFIISFNSSPSSESLQTGTPGTSGCVFDIGDGANDWLRVATCSPLNPDTAVAHVVAQRPGDDPFIDVDIFI